MTAQPGINRFHGAISQMTAAIRAIHRNAHRASGASAPFTEKLLHRVSSIVKEVAGPHEFAEHSLEDDFWVAQLRHPSVNEPEDDLAPARTSATPSLCEFIARVGHGGGGASIPM